MAAIHSAGNIESSGNRISVSERIVMGNFHLLLAALHDRVEKRGYQDIILDFSECTAAFSGPMLSICSQVLRYRVEEKIEFDLLLPHETRLANLFRNANWAWLIDSSNYSQSEFRGTSQVPTTQFTDPSDLDIVTRRVADGVMRSLSDFSRKDFNTLEWAISEVTDNVLQHARSPIGGLASLSTFRARKRVEYVVADSGIGIPESMRSSRSGISDVEALDLAIREDTTSNSQTNAGNGLFGCYEISRLSGGHFQIHSGHARLDHARYANQLNIRNEKILYHGTLVVGGIDLSVPNALSRALRFQDRPYEPVDAIELNYESKDAEEIKLIVREEVLSFGSRQAADPFRRKLENLIAMAPGRRIRLDFSEVAIVSSSFADEVFGKLFVRIGAVGFANAIAIEGANSDIRGLVDRAVSKRAATG